MRRITSTVAAAVLAGTAVLTTLAPASAGTGSNPKDPATWEYGGVYSCSKVTYGPGLRSYTRPSPVAFVVIKNGKDYFVSDLGEANEGDSTYTFSKDIRFVITCLFV
ncbi:hypothetical protein ACWFNE_21175 [Cellulomonas sp. NPDC055163]